MLKDPVKLRFRFLANFLRIFMKLYYKIEVQGLENLPARGPAIFVANHTSYLDILLIGTVMIGRKLLYRTFWVMGKTTFRNRFLHWFYSSCPVVVVNGTVKRATQELEKNRFVVIFPEGFYHFNRHKHMRQGTPVNFERKIGNSAAILSLKTGSPVIPLGIQGTEEALPPYHVFPKRGKLVLKIGRPFVFARPEPEEVTDEMIAHRSNLIMAAVDGLSGWSSEKINPR